MAENVAVQRIRGPDMRVLLPCNPKGVPLVEALVLADEAKRRRVLASNRVHDRELYEMEIGSDAGLAGRQLFSGLYPVWTGTMVGYEKPGKAFGREIVYTDPKDGQRYVFPVDDMFRGEKNAILVVEHPDFTLGDAGKDLVVVAEPGKVGLVPNFPETGGWYQTDAKYGIPIGEELEKDTDVSVGANPIYCPRDREARYLWRGAYPRGDPEGEGMVTLLARGRWGIRSILGYGQAVRADCKPSEHLGVAVEEPNHAPALLKALMKIPILGSWISKSE